MEPTGDNPDAVSRVAAWDAPVRAHPDAVEPEDAFSVDVAGFEGPLDLLLALARTRKVDLSAISMLALADQYLAFIAETTRVRLELAGDYLVMAAWLAFLKSRLLLPREMTAAGEPTGEELAQALAFRLQRLDAMRHASAELMGRLRLGRDIFQRGMPEAVETDRTTRLGANVFDLMQAYGALRVRTIPTVHVVARREVWSIKDARRRLEALVGKDGANWVQLDLFLDQYLPGPQLSRTVLAASFGASLELAREGVVELQQTRPYGPIFLRARTAASRGTP